MVRTIVTTNVVMTVKDSAGNERTIERKFYGSNWTATKIMKSMKPEGEDVVNMSTTVETYQYKISDEEFVKHAEIL